jgi:tripartite ATP-independent transporter DctM subunit
MTLRRSKRGAGSRIVGMHVVPDPVGVANRNEMGALPALPTRLEGEMEPGRRLSVNPIGTLSAVLRISIEALLVLALVSELIVMLATVILRTYFDYSIEWSDEYSHDVLTVLCFVGAALAADRGDKFSIDFVVNRLGPTQRQWAKTLAHWIAIATAIWLCFGSFPMLQEGALRHSQALPITDFWSRLPFTVGMALMTLTLIRQLPSSPGLRINLACAAAVVAASGGIASVLLGFGSTIDSGQALLVCLCVFVFTILMGVPIGFVFVGSTVVFLVLSGGPDIVGVPPEMYYSMSSFVILAAPFFIWAGLIMMRGGLSARLSGFMEKLVGHIRGGVLQVVVVTMYFFSGISGSKTADMAAVGSGLRGLAASEGVTAPRFAAVLSAAAAMGETIPPSVIMIILASTASVSLSALFVAGILPALLLAACLMVTIYVQARREGLEVRKRAPGAEVARAGVVAVPALLVPVILGLGIVKGIASPTEVSAVAVIYGIAVAAVLYRQARLRDLWDLTAETAALTGMILFIVSAASAFSTALTAARLPELAANMVANADQRVWLFMLASIVLFVVLGSFLEGVPAMLVLAPIMIPAATSIGIDPIQYCIVMIISLGIGFHMPPLGIGLYVAAMIGRAPPMATFRPMLVYVAVLLVGVVIIAFVPQISLWAPAVFNLR